MFAADISPPYFGLGCAAYFQDRRGCLGRFWKSESARFLFAVERSRVFFGDCLGKTWRVGKKELIWIWHIEFSFVFFPLFLKTPVALFPVFPFLFPFPRWSVSPRGRAISTTAMTLSLAHLCFHTVHKLFWSGGVLFTTQATKGCWAGSRFKRRYPPGV